MFLHKTKNMMKENMKKIMKLKLNSFQFLLLLPYYFFHVLKGRKNTQQQEITGTKLRYLDKMRSFQLLITGIITILDTNAIKDPAQGRTGSGRFYCLVSRTQIETDFSVHQCNV